MTGVDYATRHFPDVAQPARVPPALGADPLSRPTIILSGLASSAQDCRTFRGRPLIEGLVDTLQETGRRRFEAWGVYPKGNNLD